MAKRIVIIVFVGIGLFLGYLFSRDQLRRHTEALVKEGRRLDVLAMIAMAQEQFRRDKLRDEDKDGVGEFGAMADLFRPGPSGTSCVQAIFDRYFETRPLLCLTPGQLVLSNDLRLVVAGYIYSVSLPGTADGRERNYGAFAHPEVYKEDDTYKTYFLEGRAPCQGYFTAYEGYQGKAAGLTPEKVYRGEPFASDVRTARQPLTADEAGEEAMRALATEIRGSQGTLWIPFRIAYPEGFRPEK